MITTTKITRISLLLMLALLLIGCAAFLPLPDASESELREEAPDTTIVENSAVTEGLLPAPTTVALADSTTSDKALPSAPVVDAEDAETDVDGDTAFYTETTEEVVLAMPATGGGGAGGGGEDRFFAAPSTITDIAAAPVAPAASPLNAGEIDDNAKWDDYMTYYRETTELYCDTKPGYMPNCRDFARAIDVTGRNIITVLDASGFPVPGATVDIYADSSIIFSHRTYADGRTLYFPNMINFDEPPEQFSAVATKNGESAEIILEKGRVLYEIVLENVEVERDSVQIDVMFLIDATGSMSDEIAQLQQNILAISSQVDALPGDVNARYGLVAYRDRGDDYVTRVYEFTPDVTAFQADLNALRADGGGDTPEALNEGLEDALTAVEWRGTDAIKLIFIVADAPPQLAYQDDVDYDRSILDALERGIKIHTLASSGLDAQGEFIFRQISQVTMGHFLFLTYEGGIPGEPGEDREDLHVGDPEDEQGVGDYSVEQLDELVLHLITDEIARYRGESIEE